MGSSSTPLSSLGHCCVDHDTESEPRGSKLLLKSGMMSVKCKSSSKSLKLAARLSLYIPHEDLDINTAMCPANCSIYANKIEELERKILHSNENKTKTYKSEQGS